VQFGGSSPRVLARVTQEPGSTGGPFRAGDGVQ